MHVCSASRRHTCAPGGTPHILAFWLWCLTPSLVHALPQLVRMPCRARMPSHHAMITMDANRRGVLGAATATIALAAAPPTSIAATTQTIVPRVDALVWRTGKDTGTTPGQSNSTTSKPACTVADARAAFGPKFINYLARFLLAYDRPSRRLWRARATEIPLSWSEKQVADVRMRHLGEFVGAVEVGLIPYAP